MRQYAAISTLSPNARLHGPPSRTGSVHCRRGAWTRRIADAGMPSLRAMERQAAGDLPRRTLTLALRKAVRLPPGCCPRSWPAACHATGEVTVELTAARDHLDASSHSRPGRRVKAAFYPCADADLAVRDALERAERALAGPQRRGPPRKADCNKPRHTGMPPTSRLEDCPSQAPHRGMRGLTTEKRPRSDPAELPRQQQTAERPSAGRGVRRRCRRQTSLRRREHCQPAAWNRSGLLSVTHYAPYVMSTGGYSALNEWFRCKERPGPVEQFKGDPNGAPKPAFGS
ncbi:hypothetical protein Sliba_00370 [Streptomyces nigrescens]|uniref:Uncharacterized protein n=1 Tax=Streptomyces nigrescens TaxID=1920 RepID=A0A640T8R9_STRNI|nr:hypothetical protein Sliba_00370 [Streptomyces libani subsp. libani]GGW04614.1 hypothetical protein GCM10010500_67050 [Streptomyces libani subsp. libani]